MRDFIFIATVLFATFVGLGLLGYGAYARSELRRLRALDYWSGEFSRHAMRALEQKVSSDVCDVIAVINRSIGNPEHTKILYRVLVDDERPKRSMTKWDQLHKELVFDLIYAGFLAISYSSRIYGDRTRSAMPAVMAKAHEDPRAMIVPFKTTTFGLAAVPMPEAA